MKPEVVARLCCQVFSTLDTHMDWRNLSADEKQVVLKSCSEIINAQIGQTVMLEVLKQAIKKVS